MLVMMGGVGGRFFVILLTGWLDQMSEELRTGLVDMVCVGDLDRGGEWW